MIEQYVPQFSYIEKQAIQEYMDNPGWITEYKKTFKFEQQISSYLGVKHCVVVNNGTIAISLALLAAGIRPNDLVVVSNMTMYATATAVSFIGAIPIFVDINSDNLLMDLQVLDSVIQRMQPKAVVYVSLNGRWDTTGQLLELQSRYSHVAFIEDAAQSFGSNNYRGKIGGGLSMATFSFSTPKIITTGQGGCIVTDDSLIDSKLRKLKDFGRSPGKLDEHDSFGVNAKFTELQAIIGLAQLQQIEYRTLRKRQMYELYTQYLAGVSQVSLVGIDSDTVPWFIDIRCQKRAELMTYLLKCGIGTRRVYLPITFQEYYYSNTEYPNSKRFSEEGLWLPCSFSLKDDQIEYICYCIKEFYNAL